MNEEALLYSFDLFTKDGYNGSQEQYIELLSTNSEALEYSYGLFQKDGYNGTVDDFQTLMGVGVKKKGGTVSVSGDGSLVQPTTTQSSTGTQDSTLEFSDVELENPELKMNVLDIVQQLPTLNYNELNKEGQQYVTETASKYGLTENQILAQARTKKAGINRAGVTDFLYNAYKKGDARLGEGIVSIPSVLFQGAALISDPINRALGLKETNLEAFEEFIGTKPVLDSLIDEQEYRQKQAEIYKKDRKIEGGMAENFFESGNISDGFLLLGESIAESAPVSVGIMAASASGIGLIPLAAGATTVMTGPELRAQKEQFPEQSDFTNVMKAVGMAGAEMVFSTISQGTLGKVYRDIIFRQGAEIGRKTFKKGLISMYETAIRKTGPIAAGLGEGIEESATQITQNLIDGRPVYEGVPDAFLAGVGSGGVYGAPISGIKGIQAVNKGIAKRRISKKVKSTKFDDITQVFESDQTTDLQLDLVDTKRADEVLVAELKNKVDKGELTQEEADKINQNYFDTAVGNVKVKPLNLTTEQKTKAIDLLKEKRALTEAINEIDDSSLSVAQQERLNEVNDELSNLVKPIKKKEDAVSKQSPEGVDVQEQARDGEELGEGDTSGEVAGPLAPKTNEDTQVSEEEITELTEEQKDEVSDLEYSLGLKPQKTKQKTKQGKESPIDVFFGETIEDTTESLSDNLVINKKDETVDKTTEQVQRINSVTKIATTAAKAISKLLPNTRIVLHDSTTEFQKYVTTSEAEAEFNPSDNVIHIDLSKATDITVPHEIFHAVFLSKAKTDQKATRQADLLVKKLQAADLPSEVKERLDSFVKKYTDSPGTRNEERLAELMGILAEDYSKVNDVEQNMIRNFLKQLARVLGLDIGDTINTDNEVLNLLNTLAQKVVTGEEITETDIEILEETSLDTEQEQGSGGQVGTFDVTPGPRQRKSPGIETDTRSYASLIQDRDLKDFQGQSFVTNMYDFTNAGPTEIAPGIVLQLDGGKSYVPMMMERQGLKLGDKSNLAAFNSKENAESFARNAQGANSNLFAPHVGTKEGSWQFQQNLLEQLTDAALNNNILTNKELINTFNQGLKSEAGIKAFNIFKKRLGKNIKNLNSFIDNPTSLIELLDINNNYSPDLRKILNDKLSANKKYQERIGVNNKLDFVSKFEDPLNKGSQGGDLVGLIEFDNNTFEISKPQKGDVDYHPSFAYTIKANINGIYQPTEFYQSNNATESYTKYNKKGKTVSEKAKVGEKKFRTSNVSSSAGAIPKVGTVTPRQRIAPIEGDAITIEGVIEQGRAQGFSDASIKAVLQGRGFKASDINTALEEALKKGESLPQSFKNISNGLNLFRSLRSKINTFKNTTNKKTKEKPSNAEVRARALEILRNTEQYKELSESQQNELVLSIDKLVGSRANKTIQREISRIKNIVKGFKKGAKDLRAAQIELKNFIRLALPVSEGYSQTDIANVISIITSVKSINDLPAAAEKVFKKVEKERERIKKRTIKDILSFVNKKAKVRKTQSNKSRSAGLDSQGQQFFSQVSKILKAALGSKPIDRMAEIANELSDIERYNEIIAKEARGEKLSVKDSKFLDKSIAFEMFADIKDLSLEEVQDLFEDLQLGAEQSKKIIQQKRIRKAQEIEKLKEQATDQIETEQDFMYETDEEGNKVLKNLEQDRRVLWDNFNKKKTWAGLREVLKTYDFVKIPGITDYFRKRLAHLGSLVKILDNYSDGFFTKNIYDRLNIMSENSLKGYYTQQDVLDSLANSIEGIDEGYRQINELLFTGQKQLTIKGKKRVYSPNELLRIYALSLNEVQRAKLINQGFNESVLAEIEKELGSQLTEFANKIVDYLSTDYFEGVNDVFKEVNDVNLGYVENYFPTRTKFDDTSNPDFITKGDFSAAFTAENSPALKERTDKKNKVEVDKGDTFTSVLNNHLEQMERFKSYAQGVKDLNAIFNTPSVKNLMDVTQTTNLIRQAVLFDVNPNYGLDGLEPTFISKIQSKYTSFALAFRIVQIPKQATSFINAYSEYQFRPGVNTPVLDFIGFMADFAKVIANLPAEIKKAQEISATFKSRLEQGLAGDVYGLETGLMRLVPKTSKRISKTQQAFRTGAAAPTVIGDVIGVMGYMANYNRNIANGMSKKEALKAFNDYNATQQSRRNTDKIPLQRSNDELKRTFTMFGSTLFLQINKTTTSLTAIMKGKATTKQIRDFALNLGVANVLFVVMSNLAKLIEGDDEDREEVMWKMGEAMVGLNLLYQIPLIGGFAESATNAIKKDVFELPFAQRAKFTDDVVNPFSSIFYKTTRFYKQGDWSTALIPVIELAIGAQIDPVVGLFNYFKDLDFDEGEIYDILGISKSYRPREKKLAKKPKLTID